MNGTSIRPASARWDSRPVESSCRWPRRGPDNGNASAADPIDRESSRLAFQALIYPGRSGDIQPTKESPPVFLAASYTDRQDISEGLAEAYLRFKRAGVVAELHIYSTGGHGFGLRATNKRPVGAWIARFEEWMRESGFVK